MWYKIDNFKINSLTAPANIDAMIPEIAASRLGFRPGEMLECRIFSRSLDARRGAPSLLYSLLVESTRRPSPRENWRALEDGALQKYLAADPELPDAPAGFDHPIVVGTGPCGIFAALSLALAGAKPVVLDRGFDIARRDADCAAFLLSRTLNPESNLLIGEGGAGTYSDGKLYTGTKDRRSAFIIKSFIEAGAPAEIGYFKRPHIGSDYLGRVAVNLRKKIEDLGGTFHFGCQVTELIVEEGRCRGVRTASGETFRGPAVLLAMGLGGRDLSAALRKQGVAFECKPFQVGCRIEHPQRMIDHQQYREPRRPAALEAAAYSFVSRPNAGLLPVSTFCMCPGGSTVMASAWENQVVSNGMSCHARAGEFANSALIMTVPPERFGTPEAAYGFLRELERGAFTMGGGDYTFPAQDAAGFLRGEPVLENAANGSDVGLHAARLDRLFPPDLRKSLGAALKHFDRQCPGFIARGKMIGFESCVSSPVRFLRDPETMKTSMAGLWLGGEGAGYAGGIMSAAADGMKLACAMLE